MKYAILKRENHNTYSVWSGERWSDSEPRPDVARWAIEIGDRANLHPWSLPYWPDGATHVTDGKTLIPISDNPDSSFRAIWKRGMTFVAQTGMGPHEVFAPGMTPERFERLKKEAVETRREFPQSEPKIVITTRGYVYLTTDTPGYCDGEDVIFRA